MDSGRTFKGDNRLLLGIFLGVITFWLFANSLVNIVPTLQQSFNTKLGTINAAVSLTALLCGLLVVGAGGLADRYGRMKLTYIGLILSVIGSGLIIIPGFAPLLIIGRAIQGISGACIMPTHWIRSSTISRLPILLFFRIPRHPRAACCCRRTRRGSPLWSLTQVGLVRS